jgi:hypothetical protein
MSHRLRLVVDEEVRAAGHELELQVGGVVVMEPNGILRDQPVLRAEQHESARAAGITAADDRHKLREDELPVQRGSCAGRGRARAARRGTR